MGPDDINVPWEQFPAPQFGGKIQTQKDIRDQGGYADQNVPTGQPPVLRVLGTATASDYDSLVAAERAEMAQDQQEGT